MKIIVLMKQVANKDAILRVNREEKWIEERVLNALAQDYPADRLEVVVASDGSTDGTATIVERLARRYPGRVRLCDFSVRRGKASRCRGASVRRSVSRLRLAYAPASGCSSLLRRGGLCRIPSAVHPSGLGRFPGRLSACST